jgi:rare lipoprotein A (peptidoglycan hydrolase)
MAVIAALFVVGLASEQIIRAIRFAQLGVSLAPTVELYALPAIQITTAQPTFALPVFAVLPETQLREPTVALNDASLPDTLRPVTTTRMMRAQEITRLPFDTSTKQPIDALVAGQVTVMASYYGKELAGRRTASGEKFNPGAMTAAHRTLRFGTRVRVTHSRNGRSVTVRINDRGPFIKGRSIDLSAAAAAAIGMGGSARVHLNVIR